MTPGLSCRRLPFEIVLQTVRYQMRDRETGSLWDGFEGRATSGALEGQRLQGVTAHLSYWFSWHSFFPDTTVLAP